MATTRENQSTNQNPVRYDIDGNVFRAYFDASGELLFVIDDTISDIKPNTTLVMNGVVGRKWDDVIANDYGIDLETVRPRRDNKYQKLDVEYAGLDIYDALIQAYEDGDDISAHIARLGHNRVVASRTNARDRLGAANDTSDKARETIARTNDTIADLQSRLRELRAKLSAQKKMIGREPTKRSASKILRIEAQIDIVNEKLARAKKRLDNARRRLATAEEDAEDARQILDLIAKLHENEMPHHATAAAMAHTPTAIQQTYSDAAADDDADDDTSSDDTMPATPVFTEITTFAPQSKETYTTVADDEEQPEITDSDEISNPRTEEMPEDKNVKPLFDQDPEILDEELAFKPIEFNVGAIAPTPGPSVPVVESGTVVDDVTAPSPLSFVPPPQDTMNKPDTYVPPVLDTITSVQTPSVDNVDNTVTTNDTFIPHPATTPTPQYDDTNKSEQYDTRPDVSVAPADSAYRPTSPLKRQHSAAPIEPTTKKPTVIYYILLLVLIVLSIFTLWMYQKSNGDMTPDLAVTTPRTEEQIITPDTAPSDVIDATEIVFTENIPEETTPPVAEPEPVPVAVVAPNPVIEPQEPEPIPVKVDVPPVTVPQEPTVTAPVTPKIESEPQRTIPTEEEILASKPAYNVSQQERMFIADDGYVSDRVYSETETDYDVYPVDDNSEIIPPSTAQTAEETGCANGALPDIYGCCPGEELTDLGDQGFFCCVGDDCFDPVS